MLVHEDVCADGYRKICIGIGIGRQLLYTLNCDTTLNSNAYSFKWYVVSTLSCALYALRRKLCIKNASASAIVVNFKI